MLKKKKEIENRFILDNIIFYFPNKPGSDYLNKYSDFSTTF